MHEGFSIVLEGVHLVPGLVPAKIDGALVVHVVLSIDDERSHAAHFWVRDATTEGMRPVQKYLDALDDIRLLQDNLLEQARAHGVPVVHNRAIEGAIGEVMELVFAEADRMRSE
jgi:2-phosphoglycerate kinase